MLLYGGKGSTQTPRRETHHHEATSSDDATDNADRDGPHALRCAIGGDCRRIA